MNDKELMEKTDKAILELVYNKHLLLKAYNYYNGKRDPELFKYLEENFGIGSATEVEFTPLLKKHVDALVGEYLGTPILPKISCKDSQTISNITREKLIEITHQIVLFLKDHLNNSLMLIINGKEPTDTSIKKQLDAIIEDIDLTFVSLYEIAALNIILYIMQSRETDLITKLRLLLTDLLTTGYTFFKVSHTLNKSNIKIEVLNPLNVFIDRNPESPYVKDSYRVVIRHWLSKSLILAKYGKQIKKSDLEEVDKWEDEITNYKRTYGDIVFNSDTKNDPLPGYPELEYGNNLIPVYEVEWIETDDDFIMQRYSTIKIGEEIYVLIGKDKNVIRSIDNPSYCSLSINGVYFLNRSLQPYSLILKCASLQD